MKRLVRAAILLASAGTALAFQARPETGRFDALTIPPQARPTGSESLPLSLERSSAEMQRSWSEFFAEFSPAWSVHLDRRTGAPMLVEGRGIPWPVDGTSDASSLEHGIRAFIAAHRDLLAAGDSELTFDPEASGRLSPDAWQVVFTHTVAGVPVAGERYVFTIGHCKLISFGAPRWSRIDVDPLPAIDAAEALARAAAHMKLGARDGVDVVGKGALEIVPHGASWALVWRVAVKVAGETGTWEARVDAHDGSIRSFADVNEYTQVKGGVYPISNDQTPPDGVEQAGWPMPFASIASGTSQTSTSTGFFTCDGTSATTSLVGPYVRVIDACGAILESTVCANDLDLRSGGGTDCAVPAGSSPGNTHAARTGFYHLNRIAEHARTWLPTRAWLTEQLTDNVNINNTCNAYWNGLSVNFYRSGGGCGNTGEISGIFLHEWGHGLDTNDGGGLDNPGEAYADIVSMLSTHNSCIGRGFKTSPCAGYGDTCLTCTGVREQDFAGHASQTPATPDDFVTIRCPIGNGPCGREVHCEAHVAAETLWDLATRDLPASGLDPASAWQVTDSLWYRSRLGSGGDAYNCALPDSDGCSATSWFTKMRAVDDDDGNLANGTPHAAAIFGAFNRHGIACGLVDDASNQSSSICPVMGSSILTGTRESGAAQLDWTPVANATAYNVLRNESSCASGSTIVATVTGTSYLDVGLQNGLAEHYSVQAVGTNSACDGPLSNCVSVVPQPLAGVLTLDAAAYSCAGTIRVTVSDANIGAAATTAKVTSPQEPAGETITLTQTAPGSVVYTGTILTTGTAAAADGKISVANGGTVTATYIDADDGDGGVNRPRTESASIDCIAPAISLVQTAGVTGTTARITWTTSEPASGTVRYGTSAPPALSATVPAKVTSHTVDLTGLSECTSYLYSVESADAVGNVATDTHGGAYYAFATIKNTTPSFPATDGPVAIPDATPAGASSTIVVTDNKPVQKVVVTIDHLSHTYDRDLVITLVPPTGAPITLANRQGGAGGQFVGTVFDDDAGTPIGSGAAPFTGSFQPDSPLSAATGINAAGSWQLHVVDVAAGDTGTIDSWTLTLAYPAQQCVPHAALQSIADVSNVCPAGGAGNGDGVWDAGERVTFKVRLNNDGVSTLTNVHATIVSPNPDVVMLQGTASFPSLAPGASADSQAPYVTATIPTSLACGGAVPFQIASITSDQGTWSGGPFAHAVGLTTPSGGTPIDEPFSSGIPATWTIVDGGTGGGAASTWTTANPGGRSIAAPMAAPTPIVDSDAAGQSPGILQDEQLISPALDLSGATAATLQFDEYFDWYSGNRDEVGDVDVRSSATGSAWTNVLRHEDASTPNPSHPVLDISAQAAGATFVQVRFHYFNAHYEWYWQIDNVKVSFTGPGSCAQHLCTAVPSGAKPVPEGAPGIPLRASKAAGGGIALTWDVSTCSSADHHLLYGDLTAVASMVTLGAACDLGTTGTATWTTVPAGSLWFAIVGDDNASREGTWGQASSGPRGGIQPSGRCGMSTRDNSGTCP